MSDIVISAPGKVILHGEHSVVYGKLAVAASLNLRCFLRATCHEEDTVVLELPDLGLHREWSVSSLQKDLLPNIDLNTDADGSFSPPSEKNIQMLQKFADTHSDSATELALVSFLYLYCCICGKQHDPRELPKVKVCLVSQLPVGAGLGSSAAFAVCLSTSLLCLSGKIPLSNSLPPCSKRDSDVSADDTKDGGGNQFEPDTRQLINKWAFLVEKIIHGRPSGIDNSVSVHGGAIRFQNEVIKEIEEMPYFKILLVNTKVPRSTKTLVANVRKRYEEFPKILVPVIEAMCNLAHRCIEVFTELYHKPTCRQFFTELEELISMNQHLLNCLGVGHPSLDKVVQVTAQHGLTSKLTGAGGGGCAFALLTPDTLPENVQAAYQDLRQAGFDCWETTVGAIGTCFHPHPQSDSSLPSQLFT